MWKYILICSVGIGFALFGTIMFELVESSVDNSVRLVWYKTALVFVVAGYGTKMGLAPFHTWLPDAHSEAPGPVSALLSGALLNCSFLAIVRFLSEDIPGVRNFACLLLVILGVASLIVAAFFIVSQADYKRMLAYSSVEHMGIIALLWGLSEHYAAYIHIVGHSLIKMSLFLLAGNILLAYGTRAVASVGGIFGRIPRNAVMWCTGAILICGMPPSPLFITEFVLINAAGPWLGTLILLCLFIIFAGMSRIVIDMCMGGDAEVVPASSRLEKVESLFLVPCIALTAAIVSGVVLSALVAKGVL
jgi:hydrogenase-4 component F